MLEKKEGRKQEKEKQKQKKENYRDLGSVASPSFSSHGRAGLNPFQGYIGSTTKPREPSVYDGDGAHDLLCARGPCVPHAHGRIPGDLRGIL
jgi:hypothetical protein